MTTRPAPLTAPVSARAAADALVQLLPTPVPLVATIAESVPDDITEATIATFVGAPSADLGLVLNTELASLDEDSGLVGSGDIVRPAFEAASAALGEGVLGEVRTEDATTLFGDESSTVFALTDGERDLGWFAVRVREHGRIGEPITHEVAASKLGRISNVEMSLTVEIGRTRMSVRDVLDLEPGGVVELDRSAGAPADVLLNGRLIAHGEVVVVDQDYGVRITRILDVADGLS